MSPERKETILQKIALPHSLTVAELTNQEGISTTNLYSRRKVTRERGAVLPSNSASPETWGGEDKFHIALEAAPVTDLRPQRRGRMNSLPDRQQAVALIQQTHRSEARLVKAWALLNLRVRTYQCRTAERAVSVDQRPVAVLRIGLGSMEAG